MTSTYLRKSAIRIDLESSELLLAKAAITSLTLKTTSMSPASYTFNMSDHEFSASLLASSNIKNICAVKPEFSQLLSNDEDIRSIQSVSEDKSETFVTFCSEKLRRKRHRKKTETRLTSKLFPETVANNRKSTKSTCEKDLIQQRFYKLIHVIMFFSVLLGPFICNINNRMDM